jgi:putative transposase
MAMRIGRGRRSVRAATPAAAEMSIKGVSTREDEPSCAIGSSTMANAVLREFGIESLCSSQVSRAAQMRDGELDARRNRPLVQIRSLILDAPYGKRRHGGVVRDAAVLSAIGIGSDERRRVLGVSVALSEAEGRGRSRSSCSGPRGLAFIAPSEFAGFRPRSYETLRFTASLNSRSPHEINSMRFVEAEQSGSASNRH